MSFSARSFRQSSIRERRKIIETQYPEASGNADFALSGRDTELLDLSDAMVEQAVGYMGIPLALAGPFLIDGKELMVPMATEEPSVVAAASFAGSLISRHGGIHTHASPPVMTAQIFVEGLKGSGESAMDALEKSEESIRSHLAPMLKSMEERGGGWRGMDLRWISASETLAVNLRIDVRNAMGANLLNSAAEKLRPLIEEITGGHVLMAILSNRSLDRTATARFSIPVKALKHKNFDGKDTARRIVRAASIAREDPYRAVTHNKGIMNGIIALALATGNDTRAIEAAAHAYAGRFGAYHGLSEFHIEEGLLKGSLEMPLPFASTGGAVGFHPVSRWALQTLGSPDAPELSRIAAAVGLAQNLSALRALVSEGIQSGHMSLHARKLSFTAGARGKELNSFALVVQETAIKGREEAIKCFSEWKRANG